MENTTTAVVIPQNSMSLSENAPVSYYSNDTGNGASAALLAGIATKDYYNPLDSVTANGLGCARAEISDVKWVVKDSAANIREAIKDAEAQIRSDVLREGQENMAATKDAECALSKEILETRHTLAKDILRSEYENKLAIQAAIKEINLKVDHEAERTNDKVDESRHFNAEKFCGIENLIRDNRTHELEDKVSKLQEDLQTAQLSRLICCGCGGTETLKK